MSDYKNTRNQIRLPIFLAIGLAIGILIGSSFSKGENSTSGLFSGLQKFREVITHIDKNYVDEVDTEKLVEDAIVHILHNLDPHSSYISAEDKVRANEQLQGNFEGIGIEFNIFNDTIYVVTPLSGGPSEELGIKSGDRIVEVDGKNVAGVGFTNADVRNSLKGPAGSEVEVKIYRKSTDEFLDFTITRDKIPQYSVDVGYMINDEIGYIKISRFAATTYEEFKKELDELQSKGMKKLILDLQGNPGGYMNQAIMIADEFLDQKKKIVYTRGRESRFNSEAFSERKGDFEEGPLIVLVNESSGSASEIVSGALQDNDRAIIVGRRSFGKGLVQLPIDISDGSELRLTISRYYTPSGRSIQKPYSNNENYERDILERYNRGEFFSADSIEFADSLTYKTAKGRTVYGGGGIMPDFFVPLDTTWQSPFLNKLIGRNIIQEYAFRYANENRKQLEESGYKKFKEDFKITSAMYSDLMDLGEKNDVKRNEKDLEENRYMFDIYVKSQIARRIWDNEGLYPIFNETNEVLQSAVEIFENSDVLDWSQF